MSAGIDLLRSYLRQRRELGEQELVMETLTRADLRALLRGRRAAAMERPAPESPEPRAAERPAPVVEALEPRTADGPAPVSEAPEPRDAERTASPEPRAPRPTPDALARPTVDAPARGIGADAIALLPTLDAVAGVALGCPRCRLAGTRQHVVFGEGDPRAEVLVVGEAPGADEDRTGRPFVGKAGKLLDLLLASVGFQREQVYICNVLKCRPPGNRNPQPDEVEACSPYLLRQVELVRPRVILALGNFAAQTLLGTDVSIGKLRSGPVRHRFRDVPVVPTYHPAALLRNPGWVRATWDDLQKVRALLDEG